MATDVKKVVEIELKVTGLDSKAFTSIISKFNDLADAVKGVFAAINDMQSSFQKIKIPASLTTAVNALKEFSSIKKLPNLKNVAEGFERLSKAGKFPDLGKFATELKKLSGIKLPNIKTLSIGLRELVKINTATSASQLRALSAAMKGFEDVKLPSIKAFANGLRELIKLDTQKVVSQLYKLHTALNRLAKNEAVIVGLGRIVSAMKQTEKATKQLANTTQTQVTKIGTWMGKIGTYLSYRLIADSIRALSEGVRAGIGAIIEYSQALKDLQAITGATERDVAMMGDMVKEVATKTKFSASEVAAGMRTLGQAGLTAAESTKTMQAVADLATGTLSDMASTVDLVTTAMRVFGIEAVDSGMIADVFANAVNRSKLTIDKLRTSFNYVGPIAKEAGLTFQETGAALMTLANSGLRASTMGTGLRRMLAELVAPNQKLAEAAMEAGIALDQLDPSKNDLSSVLEALGVVIDDTATAFDIFGKRGAAAALAITNTESGYNSLYATIHRTGTAAKMAETQMEGLGVSFKNLKDKLGLLMIALGDAGLVSLLKVVVNISRKLVDALTALAESAFGGFIVKVGILVGLLGAFTGAVLVAKAAVISFYGSFAFAQIVSWALGIKGATIAVTGFTVVMTDFGTAAAAVGTKIKALALSFKSLLVAHPVLLALAAIVTVAVVAFDIFTTSMSEAKEAADEAHDAFSKLDTKLGVIDSYKDKVAGLSTESEEFRQENLRLRESLKGVISEYDELYDEAVAASNSINIITGEVTDGSVAIQNYAEAVEQARMDKFNKSLESTIDKLKSTNTMVAHTTANIRRMWQTLLGFFKDADKQKQIAAVHELSDDFMAAVHSGEESIDVIRVMAAELESLGKDVPLAENIKVAIEAFGELQTEVDDTIQRLTEKEGVDFQIMSDEDVLATLESLGILTEKTALFEQVFTDKMNLVRDSFSSLTKTWREDMGSDKFQLSNLLDVEGVSELLDSAIGQVDGFAEAIASANTKEIAGYVAAKQALLDKQDAARAAFQASAKTVEDVARLAELEAGFAEDANQLRTDLFNNEALYQQKRLMDIANTAQAEITALEKTFKGRKNGAEKIASETVRINRKLADDIVEIMSITYSPKEAMTQFRLISEERKKALTDTLFDISMQEAKGVLTHEQAEQQKLDATLKSLAAQAQAAQDIADNMAVAAPGSAQASAAEKQAVKDMERYNAVKLQKMQYYNKEKLKLTKKLADDEKAVGEESVKNATKVSDLKIAAGTKDVEAQKEFTTKKKEIESTLSNKLEDIHKKYYAKLDDLRQDNIEAEQQAAADIAGIDDSLSDKIRSINQRGMSAAQKNIDNRITANRKLEEGVREIEEARRTGDEAALARGKKLVDQSSSLFEGLEDPTKAIAGVQKAAEAERKAVEVTLKLEQDKLVAKEETVRKELEEGKKTAVDKHMHDMKLETDAYTEKIKNINTKLIADLKAEDTRHKKVMNNLKDEIAEYEKQITQVEDLIDTTAAVTPSDVGTTQTVMDHDSGAALDVVAQKANNARSEVEQLALTMGLVRREGEEEIEFSLRVQNTDQVNQYIREFKNQVQTDLENNPPQLEPELDTDKTDAEIKLLLDDLKKLSDVTSEDGMEIRITSVDAVAKIDDIQIRLDEMVSDIASMGSDADMTVLVDSFNAISTSGDLSATSINTLADSLLRLNSEDLTKIVIDISVDDTFIAQSLDEIAAVVEDTEIPISLVPQIVMSPAVDVKTGIKNLIIKLKKVEEVEIKIPIYIDTEVVDDLVIALDDLNPDLGITITVYGKEELLEIQSIYDMLISKTITLIAAISGLSKWEKAKSIYDSLKNKTITITTRHITKRAGGGFIQAFADGGGVFKRYVDPLIRKGSGFKDDVHALLMKGEYVIRKSAVARVGKDALDAINYGMAIPHFALGGIVPSVSTGSLNSGIPNTAQSMGVVNLELGDKQYPVFGQTDVVNTLIDHLNTERLMRGN